MPYAKCVIDPQALERCSQYLTNGVNWGYTPEGHDFWSNIQHRLIEWAHAKDPKNSLADNHRVKNHIQIMEAQQERIRTLEAMVLERDEKIQKLGAKIIALDLAGSRFFKSW